MEEDRKLLLCSLATRRASVGYPKQLYQYNETRDTKLHFRQLTHRTEEPDLGIIIPLSEDCVVTPVFLRLGLILFTTYQRQGLDSLGSLSTLGYLNYLDLGP